MKKTSENQKWVFSDEVVSEKVAEGITRKVLAYCQEMMCVENSFEVGAIGAMHHHPHTQITYVVSGKFEFMIEDEKFLVTQGDTMLKQNDIIHGCTCLEEGKLLDFFTPMRKEFVTEKN